MATTNTTLPEELSSNTRNIRLYAEDDKALIELHKILKPLNRNMNIVDLIRESVKRGRKHVEEQWRPLTKEKKG